MFLPSHVNPIIKLTEECNYNCDFCRYANHQQRDGGIPVSMACDIIKQCTDYNLDHGIHNENVIFHGGEPLLYGIDRFQKIMTFEESLIDTGIQFENSIQTNASLVDEKWINFFAKYHFSVGISVDGPEGLNGHHGLSIQNTSNSAIHAYKAIKENAIDCGILCVITEQHLSCPGTFFDFLVDNQIMSVSLCYCFNSVDNKNVDPVGLGKYLIELYKLYFNAPYRIKIREFDMATRLILNHPRHGCAMANRKSCGTFLTIRPDGSIEFCDDYDLNHKGTLGNIKEHSLIELLKTDVYQKKRMQAMEIVDKKCRNCSVSSICQSGCMRNDVGDSNYFCETFKILYPFILKTVTEYCAANIQPN